VKQPFKGNLLNPLPVALVGAMVNGRANFLVIGYMSPFNFGKHIFFSLYKKRYTRIGIRENMTFSVNIPTVAMLEEVKVCGSKSGRDFDKSDIFEVFFGNLDTAPMIKEAPLNMECEVTDILDYDPNEGIVGRVVGSYVDQEVLLDGKLDLRNANPMLWATGGDFNYYQIGNRIQA